MKSMEVDYMKKIIEIIKENKKIINKILNVLCVISIIIILILAII